MEELIRKTREKIMIKDVVKIGLKVEFLWGDKVLTGEIKDMTDTMLEIKCNEDNHNYYFEAEDIKRYQIEIVGDNK
jgi:hypothetical protein